MAVSKIFWQEIKAGKSIYRAYTNQLIKEHFKLQSGLIVDIGGSGRPSYWRFLEMPAASRLIRVDFAGDHDVTANIETSLPLGSRCADTVLLFNVLEHIYHHQQLADEIARILKPGGTLLGVVPFLHKVHGSPYDFYRYTAASLNNIFEAAGLIPQQIIPFGGMFQAAAAQVDLVLRPSMVRRGAIRLALLFDKLLSRRLGEERIQEWALGYLFSATRLIF